MIHWEGNRRLIFHYLDSDGAKQPGDMTLEKIVTQGSNTFLFGHTRKGERMAIPFKSVTSTFTDWDSGKGGALHTLLQIDELPNGSTASQTTATEPANNQPSAPPDANTQKIEQYVEAHSKSAGIAFLLALFFGPIGYLYASPIGGVIMILISLVSLSTVVVPVIAWLLCMILAPIHASHYNNQLRAKAEMLTG
jgi:hypothetical protein